MSEPVRLAGHGRRKDGADVTWTLAEGRRGRRWRETISHDGRLVHALLFETGPDRRFSHLELATPEGLATLHPEGDGTLHGNVVRGGRGVAHVVGLPYGADASVIVAGSVMAAAALAWAEVGEGIRPVREVVVLDPGSLDLTVRPATDEDRLAIDAQGAPRLAGSSIWALEAEGRG
jgi:hypothetical protein